MAATFKGESEANNYFNLIVVGDGTVRFFATTDAQGSATVGTVDQLNT